MKRQTTLAMFGILFAAAMALGMVSVSGFSQPLFVASTTDTKATNQMGMFGHITLTATDPDGKIISYIQTDNIIVNVGENCVAESLFNVTTTDATHECAGQGTHGGISGGINVLNGVADGGFTYIAIGDIQGTNEAGAGNVTLAAELGIGRVKDTKPMFSESTADEDSSAKVTLKAVFTATADNTVIDESGIFDDETVGNMLARQTFTAITLADQDKLTVEWEITIGS